MFDWTLHFFSEMQQQWQRCEVQSCEILETGPKYLDDLHFLFDKVHITGATAFCPGDISSDDSSSDDVLEVAQKDDDSSAIKLSALKKPKAAGKKRKQTCGAAEDNKEKNPFFRM
jgi:hypothetical protein